MTLLKTCIFAAILIILSQASTAWATSTIYFSNDEYVVEVVIGHDDNSYSVVQVRFYIDSSLIFNAYANEFEDVSCNFEELTARFLLPAKGKRQRFELKAKDETAQLFYAGKTIKLSCDWEL